MTEQLRASRPEEESSVALTAMKDMFNTCIECVWDTISKQTEVLKQQETRLKLELQKFEEEKKQWHQERSAMMNIIQIQEDRVSLDIGGVIYATTRKVLTKYPDSMLGIMFSGRHAIQTNEQGNYFIDRDGQPFRGRR